jgi:hypothetical protein
MNRAIDGSEVWQEIKKVFPSHDEAFSRRFPHYEVTVSYEDRK